MISVVIPMYNSRDTIAECIESVLCQTKVDLIEEIIVVDDGSSDGSFKLVKERYSENPIVKIIRKANGGVSSARNAGIRVATGEWIALLDSDDIWKKEKIEKQWREIEMNSAIRFIGTNRNEENIRWGKRVNGSLYALDLKHILIKNWPHTSTALIKRSVFNEVGMFNEKMRYAEDGDMWNRIAIRYTLFYITESLEIAGRGKMQFGESGLSSNLKGMHGGNMRNIECLKKDNFISMPFYIFLKLYNDMKYVRRILLSKYRGAEDEKNINIS